MHNNNLLETVSPHLAAKLSSPLADAENCEFYKCYKSEHKQQQLEFECSFVKVKRMKCYAFQRNNDCLICEVSSNFRKITGVRVSWNRHGMSQCDSWV